MLSIYKVLVDNVSQTMHIRCTKVSDERRTIRVQHYSRRALSSTKELFTRLVAVLYVWDDERSKKVGARFDRSNKNVLISSCYYDLIRFKSLILLYKNTNCQKATSNKNDKNHR